MRVMKVKVNSKERETSAENLAQLVDELSLPRQGVAVAVSNRMVPRAEWEGYALSEGLDVIVIKAACGG